MKKLWMAIVLAAAVMAAGCSANNEGENNTSGNNATQHVQSNEGANETADEEEVVEEEEAVEEEEEGTVDEAIVVFPASLNMDGDIAGMTTEIQEAGATDVVENEDGSVSVTIAQDQLDQLLDKYHAEITEMINGLQAEEYTGSIKELQYDEETYSVFDLTVDRAAFEAEDSMDGLVLFGLMMQSLMYQVYAGMEEADLGVTFNMIDASTGEVYETNAFPE